MIEHARDLRFRILWISAWSAGLAVTLWLSLMKSPDIPSTLPHFDKVLHFVGYVYHAGLGLSIFRRKLSSIGCVLGLCLFGIGVELLQGSMNSGRQASAADVLANVAGIGAGFLCARRFAADWLGRIDELVGQLFSPTTSA